MADSFKVFLAEGRTLIVAAGLGVNEAAIECMDSKTRGVD
jgi:hypothetical protein